MLWDYKIYGGKKVLACVKGCVMKMIVKSRKIS